MKQNAWEANLLAVLALLFLTATGIILIFMPHRIQRIASLDRWGPFSRTRFMWKYSQSPLYIWDLRLGGAAALVFAALLLYDLLFH